MNNDRYALGVRPGVRRLIRTVKMPVLTNIKIIKKTILASIFSAVAIFACLSDAKVTAKAADTVTLRNNYALDMTACGDTEKDGVSVIFAFRYA